MVDGVGIVGFVGGRVVAEEVEFAGSAEVTSGDVPGDVSAG